MRLSEEESLMAHTARGLAHDGGGLEAAADRDRHDTFPADLLAQAMALGLGGIVGADGIPPTALPIVLDELAQVDPAAAASLAAHNACLALARRHGPATQGAPGSNLADRLAAGELAALLVTEEAHGSDTATVGTWAKPQPGGGWRVTGQKVWAVNAVAAKHAFVLANVPAPPGTKGAPAGPTLLAVPFDSPGLTVGANESLLGLRASGIRTVYLYDVAVPESALIGTVGGGLQELAHATTALHVAVAACLNGCVAGALEASARFAESRIQFQNPIGTYQAVSDGLSAIDVNLAASRALTLEAARHLGTGGAEPGLWAARAKAFASEMAIPMTRQAIRVQGGTGFMREGGTERFARDVRALQFMGGSVQMQKDLVKRHVMPGIAFPPTP